jgi:hypothetical protein
MIAVALVALVGLLALGFNLLMQIRGDGDQWRPLRAESLRRFALRRGLLASETGRCAGAIDGVTLALFIEKRPRFDAEADCAVLRCALGEAPQGLVLTNASNEVRALRDGGASTAQSDAPFSPPTTNDPVRAVLADAEVRACLLRAVRSSQWLCISNGVLELSSDRGFDTPGLAALVDPGLALVKAIQTAHARFRSASIAVEAEPAAPATPQPVR